LVGTFGDMATFSLNHFKLINCGSGLCYFACLLVCLSVFTKYCLFKYKTNKQTNKQIQKFTFFFLGGVVITNNEKYANIVRLFLDKCYFRDGQTDSLGRTRNPYFLAPNYQVNKIKKDNKINK
jgi:dTDP-4-amino-4,6-dideoxygalactose transaminase